MKKFAVTFIFSEIDGGAGGLCEGAMRLLTSKYKVHIDTVKTIPKPMVKTVKPEEWPNHQTSLESYLSNRGIERYGKRRF